MAFTLAQLEALEICLKEAEEKAKTLSEQVIPVVHTGNVCSLRVQENKCKSKYLFKKKKTEAEQTVNSQNKVGGGVLQNGTSFQL